MATIKEVLVLDQAIAALEAKKRELLKELPLETPEQIVEYILAFNLPTELYDFHADEPTQSMVRNGKVDICANFHYGYTDIVGLSAEEFQEVERLLEEKLSAECSSEE